MRKSFSSSDLLIDFIHLDAAMNGLALSEKMVVGVPLRAVTRFNAFMNSLVVLSGKGSK